MSNFFLKGLKINKVRHLKNISINLSETEKKHLILTGKNGSGKTSVVEILKEYFQAIENNGLTLSQWEETIKTYQPLINQPTHAPLKLQYQQMVANAQLLLTKFNKITLSLNSNPSDIYPSIKNGEFMFAYFPSRRGGARIYDIAKGPQKLNLELEPNSITKSYSHYFVQYLVNLKTESLFARDEQDQKKADSIDNWFKSFEKILQEIYAEEVKLEFDRKEWNLYLIVPGYERFDFNQLSDGYSAIVNIVSELLLRMEKYNYLNHEMQGIVVIDEIETHLHVALQRIVFPFLTTFFPEIQFIVTSHSPFVINSINNAVIFDLEKQERMEDMSGYSVENIIENYFDVGQYSDLVEKKIKEYEELANKKDLGEEETKQFIQLENYFRKFPLSISAELSLKINSIRLKKIQ